MTDVTRRGARRGLAWPAAAGRLGARGLWTWVPTLVLAALAAGFVACGGDYDDDDEDAAYTTSSSSAAIAVSAPPISPEAGGSANPNDAAQPLMYFEGHRVNPFVDADEDPLSTFALDGDTASYEILGLYLDYEASLPPADSVRVEEYVNSLPQGYPATAQALGLHLDAGPSPFGEEGYVLLRVGVSNPAPTTDRDPVSLIFVIDTSGSMEADNRLGLAKTVIEGIANQMIEGDRAAIVTYGSEATLVRDFVDAGRRRDLISAARGLHTEGSTYAEAGLRMAYDLAGRELKEERSVRIVLFSDGVANVGATGPESILELVDQQAQRRATLTAVGVGISGNYNDVLMEALANRGNGAYHYLVDQAAGERFLSESAAGVFSETARDARIQVEFDPATVRKYRLIGYENRAVADEDFEDDTLDFGEPGFARDVTALYELRLEADAPAGGALASVRLRWLDPVLGNAIETQASIMVGDIAGSISDTSPYFRQDAAIAELAELLRKSFWAQCSSTSAVSDLLDGVSGELGENSDYARLVSRVAEASEHFEPYCQQ